MEKIDELEERLTKLEGKFYDLKKNTDFVFTIVIIGIIIIFWKIFG